MDACETRIQTVTPLLMHDTLRRAITVCTMFPDIRLITETPTEPFPCLESGYFEVRYFYYSTTTVFC